MTSRAHDTSGWQNAFLERITPFARRWRRQRAVARACATLWTPLLFILIVLLILRWTLIVLPWPELWLLVPVPLWALLMLAAWLLDRPPAARLARGADRLLGLDERLATALESTARPLPAHRAAAELLRRQREDALAALAYAADQVGRLFPIRLGRYVRPLAGAAGVALLIVPTLLVPSPLEPQRAEQAALRDAVQRQATALDAARRELVARPQVPPDVSALLNSELGTAVSQLQAAQTDRAGAVAALSGAEDRLREALPPDYNTRISARQDAAQAISAALPPDARLADPPPGTSDVGKAALDASQLADVVAELVANPDQVPTAQAIESLLRAAQALEASDPALAADVRRAAQALRDGDAAGAEQILRSVAQQLQQLDANQAGLQALAGAVDRLEQGRAVVAQAGLAASTATGPGRSRQAFGRQGTSAPTSAGGAPDSVAPPAGAATTPGSGDPPAAGQGQQGGPGGSPGSPPAAGNPGSSPAQTGGGGPGTTDPGGNRAGTGVGLVPTPTGPSDPSLAGAPDQVYVPGEGEPPSGSGGGPQESVPGQSTGGSDLSGSATVQGPGQNPGVHTPYQQVIGQYGTAAASALDRSTLPPDAREYVREYFSSLGR